MSNQDPDKIRAEIDQTRRDLSRNVDALSEQVKPGNVARRQGEKVTEAVGGAVSSVKERIMGTADDVRDQGDVDSMRADDLRDEAGRRISDAQDAVAGAPAQARRRTQGNPLAAGLIALGAGWLLGSLLPSSQREQQASVALKEKAQPLAEEAQQLAKESAENLKQPAQDAAQDLKTSATEAAENVKAQGQGAVEDVKAQGQGVAADVKAESKDAAQDVKGSAQDAKDDVKQTRQS